ncbi:gluconokinase [Flavihumibacter rivuli]|uniref:gluconokinase n=1 Tax=Flavihumibacter rivuli TaxID=2838156 RepID=UPI001BDE3EB5|nr:gluconokinase [Flavihumibacter rivuli]ULQ57176.1 gluconokinase [Flavihumibacter rivuli]
MHHFLGLDIGTTHTKLLALNGKGEAFYEKKIGYRNGLGATLDAGEILLAVLDLLKGYFAAWPGAPVVLSCSAAMHSLLLVNDHSEPISPLYTWADNSSSGSAKAIRSLPGAHGLFQRTGTPIHPMSPLCKLHWLNRDSPGRLSEASKIVGIKEYIWHYLTGHWEVDHSIASATGLFNQETLAWDVEACAIAGIDPVKLPEPVAVTHKRRASACKNASELFPEGSWLVIGASDGCLAQLGVGAITGSAAVMTIGTSGAVRRGLSRRWVDEKERLFTYILNKDHWVVGGAINNGGLALQWWQGQVLGQDASPASLITGMVQDATRVEAGSEGLVCLPYFLGERAPVWNAEATGMFFGVRSVHSQRHFSRSILEGIAYGFRQLISIMESGTGRIEKVFATGGFTQSREWMQLTCDVLGRELHLLSDADASATGACLLGMKAMGIFTDWPVVRQMLPMEAKVFYPNPAYTHVYENGFEKYCQLQALSITS